MKSNEITNTLTLDQMSKVNKISLDKLRAYVGNNDSDIKDMIELFRQTVPVQKSKMELFMSERDWDNLNYIAHQMKPSLDILGLDASKEKARIIESLAKTGEETELLKKFVAELSTDLDEVREALEHELENLNHNH